MVVHADHSKIAERSQDMPVGDVLALMSEECSTEMTLLAVKEQQQLNAWNATQQDYPKDAMIPQLVAAQATVTPDAVALVAGEQQLTYRGLNQRANQLAWSLQALGVGPNVLVGLCVERGLDMIVGLLGILKAGGAYVPLDSSYPPDRLAFMVEDAQVAVLVTQQPLVPRLPMQGARLICLDADPALWAQQPITEPPFTTVSTDLAYVIYTSGSTGRPKGVEITHDSLLNLVYWHRRVFAVTATDRATQLTSPAFDATGWEVWPYLTSGASLYLLDEESRVAPAPCRDWLLEHGITITFLPTALAEGVMALEWPKQTTLRYLLTGADTLHHYPSPELPFTLVNNYGPTEATVVATSGLVMPNAHTDLPPSIGRPIDNVQVYILDEELRMVPIGQAGELHIGGAGLAKGYLRRPELTAEKFIPHPFSTEAGARLYKTGDQARFLPDGQIAFLGRIDHQIKIRGYRIEPNEIMTVLGSHPAVQTSMVIARESSPGDKRLVAYVVVVPGAAVSAASLRETLAERLPDYMIPATFVQLESLPVTPNGKVDRRALPAPDVDNTLQDEVNIEPKTPLEEKLAEMVGGLLQLEQISIDDNFFMLGGHSLLGTQLIARVAETFGVDLSLRSLFSAPTIRLLAAEIEHRLLARLESMSEEEARALLEHSSS